MAEEDIGDVRVLIPDTDAIYGAAENEYLFTDEDINRFLRVGGGSVLRAAGYAMIAVGNSEAMVEKVIRTQDLQTDGSKLQKEWREGGKLLLDAAQAGDTFEGFVIHNYGDGWRKSPAELTEPWAGEWPYGY